MALGSITHTTTLIRSYQFTHAHIRMILVILYGDPPRQQIA